MALIPIVFGKLSYVHISRLMQKRKATKLQKALAVADRVDAKAGNRASAKASRKATKSLWASGKKKR